MAEVATGTSKRTGISGSTHTPGFDMRSWQGLTQLLSAARGAHMDTVAYASFRDAVMEYAQGGGTDATLRQDIEAQIAALGLVQKRTPPPAAPERSVPAERTPQSTQPTTNTSFGSSRRTPQFRAAAAQKYSPAPTNLPTSVAPEHTDTPKKKVVPEKPRTAEVSPAEAAPKKIEVKEKTVTPETVAQQPTPRQEVPQQKQKQKPAMPHEAPRPTPSTPPGDFGSVEDAKRRVSEIKRTVLAEVGNPITMTEGGEAIGREYMKALVNALKAVSGNAPGTLATAMQALENASVRVRQAAAKKGTESTTEKKSPVPIKAEAPEKEPVATDVAEAPKSKPEPEPKSKQSVSDVDRSAPKSTGDKVVPAAIPTQKPISETVDDTQAAAQDAAAERWHTSSPDTSAAAPEPATDPVSDTHASERAPRTSTAIPSLTDQMEPPTTSDVTEPLSETPKPGPEPVAQKPTESKKSSVGQQHTKHTAKGLGQVKHDVTVDADGSTPVPPGVTTELQTPEITNGLNQLLQDWSVFRGSGFFGIGPGGAEHPLYEKLAQEQMSVVYGGYWEGAKREEILSIRDYINGWRHEQGITYTDVETFEHYLRRVVSRILKRQQT